MDRIRRFVAEVGKLSARVIIFMITWYLHGTYMVLTGNGITRLM